MTTSFADAAGLTDAGVQRQNNEDTWRGPPQNLPPDLAAAKGFLYVVADGVGGHQGGEVASRIAAQVTQELYYNDGNGDVGTSLRVAIEEANRRIYHQGISSPNEYGMSTTITAAVVRGSEVFVANVGDSRAYLIREERAHQLTTDHTLVEEQRRAGILTDQEAANHPRRNVITRSLGGELRVSVDVFEPRALAPGDRLLLCSDGLSDLINQREIGHVVSQTRNASAAVRRLVDLAKKRGAPDNVTAVVIEIGKRKKPLSGVPSGVGNYTALAAVLGTVLVLAGAVAGLLGVFRPVGLTGLRATPTVAQSLRSGTPEASAPTATPSILPRAVLVKPEDGARYTNVTEIELVWGLSEPAETSLLTPTRKYHYVVEIMTGETVVISKELAFEGGGVYRLEQPPQILDLGTYRWQVHIEEMVDATWEILSGTQSEIRTFTLVAPTSTPSPTPTPTPTPTPQPEAPIRTAPGDYETLPNPVTFHWDGSLGPSQAYQVTTRHVESGEAVQSGPVTEQPWSTSLPTERVGEWRWSVSVIQNGEVITTSEEGVFWFDPMPGSGGGPDEDEEVPQATPQR